MRAHPVILAAWITLALALSAPRAEAVNHSREEREDTARHEDLEQWKCSIKPQGPVADPRSIRAELERRPALPASKNPLLGRWALPGAGGANHAGLAGQLENLLGGSTCSMQFGAGPIEIRADTVVNGRGQASFGAV